MNIEIVERKCDNCVEEISFKIYLVDGISPLFLCFGCLEKIYFQAKDLLITEFKKRLISGTEDLYNEIEDIIGK
jgi:hypothetical protein